MKIHLIPLNEQDLLNRCYTLARKNLYENLVLTGDLFPPCVNLSDIYGVFEGKDLISCFTVFNGFQTPSVVILTTADEILEYIFTQLPPILPKEFLLVSSTIKAPQIEQYFSLNAESVEYCMITDSRNAHFREPDRSFIKASYSDLQRIDAFYKEHDTFPWNPIQLKSQFYFYKEKNNSIIACGGTHFETPELAHLGNILVLPEYRRQSIGENLVSTIGHEILKTKELISLFVTKDNSVAIQLYQKLGFTRQKTFAIFNCSQEDPSTKKVSKNPFSNH